MIITTAVTVMLQAGILFTNPIANKYFIKPEEQMEIKVYDNKIKR